MPKPQRPPTPAICPVCGEEVPRNALACPECGADHETGWREDADAVGQSGDDPGDFDYEEFTAREFGHSSKPHGLAWHWWLVAIFILAATAYFIVRDFWH